jgi:hypothetical protein
MISFIYFDIGGVAIKDFSGTTKWQDLLADLGIPASKWPTIDQYWDQHIAPRVDLDLDIDTKLNQLETIAGIKLPKGYSLHNDFIARFSPNTSLWSLIDTLIINMPVGLLTLYPGMFQKIG